MDGGMTPPCSGWPIWGDGYQGPTGAFGAPVVGVVFDADGKPDDTWPSLEMEGCGGRPVLKPNGGYHWVVGGGKNPMDGTADGGSGGYKKPDGTLDDKDDDIEGVPEAIADNPGGAL